MWRLKKRLSFIISCVCVCVCVVVCGWVSVYILHFNTIYDHVALAEAALPHHFVTSFVGPSWHNYLFFKKKVRFRV